MRYLAGLRVFEYLDPFGTERGCNGLANGRVLARKQRAPRQDRDFAAQPCKRLRQFQRATTEAPIMASCFGMVSLT